MKKETKTSIIANFNCTFGKDNKPMLTYFDEIIYPAFTEDYFRKVNDDVYFFKDTKLVKLENDRFALQGIYVRKTKLEVKTEYDPIEHKIEYTNKSYNTAPISIFTLFLDNHRLLYTTNQKGSPNIISFGATIKDLIKQVIRVYNVGKEKENKISNPQINIVNVPSENSIDEQLQSVDKIRKLKFRFFNPNGDFDTSEAFDWMFSELDEYGSKRAEITFNSPRKIEKVKKDISDSKGFAIINLDVNFKNGAKGNLDNDSLSEKYELDMSSGSSVENVIAATIETFKNNKLLNDIGVKNKKIYEDNIAKIEKFL